MKSFGNVSKINPMKTSRSISHTAYDTLLQLRLPVLLVFVILFACLAYSGVLLKQQEQAFAQTGFAPRSGSSGQADTLYRDMLASVEGAISISTGVQQRIRMFGQEYIATGTYCELKTTELRGKGAARFRLEMTVQPPADARDVSSPNSLTIVCDNTYNTIYRNYSLGGVNRVERIELKPLVEALEKHGRSDIPTEAGSLFGVGGLAGMLRELRNRYDFSDAPEPTQINDKTGPVKVWLIRGRLKPAIIAALTAETAGEKQVIPVHTPTAIDISIGMDDRFPLKFEYYWTADGSEASGEPFANLVFFDRILNSGNISETNFDYLPSGSIDVTKQVIQQLLR